MREAVIAEVSTQLSEVVGVIERHLEPTLLAVHLYGSAVDGGLKPHSDIDLLVTVTVRRSGPDCLNSFTPRDKETVGGLKRCRVVHGGVRRLRRTQSRSGQLGAHQGYSF